MNFLQRYCWKSDMLISKITKMTSISWVLTIKPFEALKNRNKNIASIKPYLYKRAIDPDNFLLIAPPYFTWLLAVLCFDIEIVFLLQVWTAWREVILARTPVQSRPFANSSKFTLSDCHCLGVVTINTFLC